MSIEKYRKFVESNAWSEIKKRDWTPDHSDDHPRTEEY